MIAPRRRALTVAGIRPRNLWPWVALLATLIIATAAIALGPRAYAVPGQCGQAIVAGSGGGFCDGAPAADGTWMHCETVYVLGFGGTNCYRVRPVGLDVDPRGWVPA